MVARITYQDNLVAGQLFTAAMADEIRDVVNALGTAADVDTGTAAGNVPVIGDDGLLPSAIIPGGGSGGGSGDVSGPGATTVGRPAIWANTEGTALSNGTAAQVMPTSGTTGYYLTFGAMAPEWAPWATAAAALGALTTTDRIPYTGIHNLDSSGAGDLYEVALIASTAMTDGQVVQRSGAALVGLTLGSAALLDAIPSGAPTTASSTAGAITLNYSGKVVLETTTTEAITSITFSNITAYDTVLWRVKSTTARDITFPAGTKRGWAGTSLTYPGQANSTVNFLIYNDNGTFEVSVGDALTVGV